jgi:nucleoside-diphosphate-sugar epimerase
VTANGVLGTAVVTGGVGFIGRRLVHSLLEQGWRVRVIDRRPGAPEGCEHVLADLVEDDVIEALHGDVVFHPAGRPGVRGDDVETERQRLRDNVVATQQVARATLKEVPLVFASSSSVTAERWAGRAAKTTRSLRAAATHGARSRPSRSAGPGHSAAAWCTRLGFSPSWVRGSAPTWRLRCGLTRWRPGGR